MKIIRIVVSIIICQLAGVVGSVFTITAIPTWYAALIKPPFSPPNWLFGPVWLALYTLMGLALALVWARGFGDKKVKQAVVLFGVQLLLNVLWSILFFGRHYTFLAFLEI